MLEGTVSGYQSYYEHAQRKNIVYSVRVASLIDKIKKIEASEKAKGVELPPLKPMMDSLNEFINK